MILLSNCLGKIYARGSEKLRRIGTVGATAIPPANLIDFVLIIDVAIPTVFEFCL